MKNRTIITVFVAVFAFFAIGISALAYTGNYSMDSDNRVAGDSTKNFSIELLSPSDYKSHGEDKEENITFWYFELSDVQDAEKDIPFVVQFRGKNASAIPFSSYNLFVYDDISLSEDHKVGSLENEVLVIDSHTSEQPNIGNIPSTLTLHIKAGSLDPGKTYYLVFKQNTGNSGSQRTKGDAIYQFKTKERAAEKEPVGDSIITGSGASFSINPSLTSSDGQAQTSALLINHKTGRYEVSGTLPFQGKLELELTMTPQSNKKASHLLAYVIDPENPAVHLQEFNIADDTETKIENEVLSIDATNLELEKTYYFVMDKVSQSGNVPFGEDVVIEFTTHSHSPFVIKGYDSTCFETGLGDGVKCSTCGAVIEEQVQIPLKEHVWRDMPATPATCTSHGYTAFKKCDLCGFEIERYIDDEVPPLGHIPVVTKEATVTCTEAGLCEEIVCSRCNQNLQLQKEVEALGHDYVDGVCTRCGDKVELVDYAENEWQGNTISIHWTAPASDTIKTQGLLKDAEGTPYYYNEFTEPFCAEASKTFAFDVKGSGANHIGKEENESPANHIFIYSDVSLSEDSLVASAAKGTITDVKRADAAVTSEGMSNILFTVPAGTLENDKTYYVVIDEKLESNQSRLIGTKVINKISTRHGEIEEVPAFNPTCTDIGREAGKMCKECKNYLEGGKEIPALGHEYKDGVCTRCGEKDPTYVEPTPEEPADTDLVVKTVDGKQIAVRGTKSTEKASDYTGIAPELGNKKVWWRVVDGDVVPDATGVFKNEYGWWRVENGKVNFDAQEIYKNEYGWWKTTNGKVTFDETGVFQNEYGWWRVEDSKVNFKAEGIYKNDYGWWKTTKGKVTFKENGVFKNEYGWWKVEKSKVNFNFTGIASNEYGTWYVKNGKVDFSKNGKVTYNGKTYNVTDGKAKLA